jgi:hypothetical protein
MGTMGLHVTGLLLAVVALAPPPTAVAAGKPQATAAPRQGPRAIINGGHDQKSSWLFAEYRELQVRKRTDRATLAVSIELRAGADLVTVAVAPRNISVWRGGRRVVVNSAKTLEAVQRLLGGSAAIFGVRAMLSDLEPLSASTAPDMALLSTAAFVASLVGDVGAPLRIADRFMEKHRGIFRQVRESGQCWTDYTNETSAAWNELQACMDEANERGFFQAAYERLACNGIWLLRAESSWFEYLKCLSPLTVVPQ